MFIDIIAIILIIYGFYSGYRRGIIDTLFDTASIIIAILATFKLSPLIVNYLNAKGDVNEMVVLVCGIALTFFVAMISIRFIGSQVEKLMKTIRLNFVNKLAGGVLFAFMMITIFSGALWLTDELKSLPEDVKTESITYPVIEQIPHLAQGIFGSLKPLFTDFWDLLNDTVDTIKVKGERLE